MKKLIEIIATILVLVILELFVFRFITDFKNTLIMVTVLVIIIILKEYIQKKQGKSNPS
ncbi:hypothetical protein ACPBEH_08125 [Latilactobacillus sp. 5-91]|uniref:hypothetical protein n=1 Tax=Latilactobacillus sp. 5-91 TaxID=3410924 RepID=UPI003C78E138